MAKGTVKWFDRKKGFGFIINEQGKEVRILTPARNLLRNSRLKKLKFNGNTYSTSFTYLV